MKTFVVEVKTQFGPKAGTWMRFETYQAKTKAEAINNARRFNRLHECLDFRSNGLIWWRAREAVAGSVDAESNADCPMG